MESSCGIRGTTHKCPFCEKTFYIPIFCQKWTYRKGTKLFCSYNCMRAYERQLEEIKKAKKAQAVPKSVQQQEIKRTSTFSAVEFNKLKTLGERLRYLRACYGYKITYVANCISMSPSNCKLYEENLVIRPRYETLKRFADFYEVDIKVLMGWSCYEV